MYFSFYVYVFLRKRKRNVKSEKSEKPKIVIVKFKDKNLSFEKTQTKHSKNLAELEGRKLNYTIIKFREGKSDTVRMGSS